MNFPSKVVENAVEHLSRLPGIGKRTALRLVLHLLKQDKVTVEGFGGAFINLINTISYCSSCFSIAENQLCEICANTNRDKTIICVVEDIRVLLAIENTMQYKGVYHVLEGLISPMDGIGPTDLRIEELVQKVENSDVKEVIFSLSTTMEGDTTNYYLFRRLSPSGVKISSIARGIAIGDELEYTDQLTLATAISSRMPYENSLSK
jgi:recombination protein RecR